MSGVDIKLHYEGHQGCASVCDVLIEHGTGSILVTVTERSDNPSTSVTNSAEVIASRVAVTMPSCAMPTVRFVEHYPDRGALAEIYAEVTFDWEDRTASNPRWRHLGSDGYHQLRAELGVA